MTRTETAGGVVIVEQSYDERLADFEERLEALGLTRDEFVRGGLTDDLPSFDAYKLWDDFRFSDLPEPGELDPDL